MASRLFVISLFSFCFFFLSCRSSTSEDKVAEPSHFASRDSTYPNTYDDEIRGAKRISLVVMRLLGHPSAVYQQRRLRFDAGVGFHRADEKCVLLEPIRDRYQDHPWSPLDFYYNLVASLEEGEEHGHRNIFFEGDDGNRNGNEDAHDATVVMDTQKSQISFLESYRADEKAEFLIQFKHGELSFKGLMKVEVSGSRPGECAAQAFLCDEHQKNGSRHKCAGSWWPIRKIRAHIDLWKSLTSPVRKLDVEYQNSEGWRYWVVSTLD